MTKKLFKRWYILIVALIIVLFSMPVSAQNDAQLKTLVIQVWSEFDQPETLIIYHGELADTVSLPVELSFNIPANVGEMNAVAVFDENGNLVNHPYQLTDGDAGNKQLTFSIDTPIFRFEYYDADILQKDGKKRTLNFNPTLDYRVDALQIEVQQPFGAQDMALSPPADDTVVGADQFNYFIYQRENLAAGETFSLTGSYTKETDTVTTDVQVGIPQPETPTETPPVASQNWQLTAGYILIGLGAVVLLVVGGMWIYNNMNAAQSDEPPRRSGQKKRKSSSVKNVSGAKSKFCHHCGAKLQPDAKFCHQCGTPRR